MSSWHHGSRKQWFRKTSCSIYNFLSGERVKNVDETYSWIADLLDTNSFITVPVYQRNTFTGRLYLTSKSRYFNYSDVEFLRQVIDQVVPMIDNIQLGRASCRESA